MFNHRADIRHADELLEERSEEAVARAEVAVSLDKIGKVELTAPYFLVGKAGKVASEASLAELRGILCARHALGRKAVGVARHAGMAELLERFRGAPAQAYVGGFEIAERGIEVNGRHIGQVRRRRYGQTVARFMGIALAGNHFQRALRTVIEPSLPVNHLCKLAQGHAVDNGNGQPSHARLVAHVQQRAVDIEAVGIGPVKNDHQLMVQGALVHEANHGDVVGIETKSYVLNISDNHVNAGHRDRIGYASPAAIQRNNGHTGLRVNAAGHVFARIGRAAKTVFGRKNGHHVHAVTQQQVERHEVRAVRLHNDARLV